MTRLSAAADAIEPAAQGMVGDASDELVTLASIAISLKRIADAASGPPSDATCAVCRYWLGGVQGNPEHGLCQRRPPLVTGGMMSAVETVRPETVAGDFCGDFSPRRD